MEHNCFEWEENLEWIAMAEGGKFALGMDLRIFFETWNMNMF